MSDLLNGLGLSAEAIEARKDAIGGSDANTIMSGNDERIIKLWRQKRGELPDDDLSGILAVQMGSFTEPLNVAWYEKQTGNHVTDRGAIAQHPTIAYMRATLDGRNLDPLYGGKRIFEAKHCGTFDSDETIFDRYLPQLTHNALCDGASGAVLSVFKGNGDWVMFEYDLDEAYAKALLEAEAGFWECVENGKPPAPLPEPAKPKPRGVIEYDMAGRNDWAVHVGIYLETIDAFDRHNTAKSEIKALVPDDASEAFGHGIRVKRDKRGALRFTVEGE